MVLIARLDISERRRLTWAGYRVYSLEGYHGPGSICAWSINRFFMAGKVAFSNKTD